MATMKKSWNPSKGLEYSAVGDNLFLFKFNDIVDKRKVMAGCPWAFDGSLLVVSDYIGNIQLSKVKLDHCSFWVRVYNLPLGWMNRKTADFIGNKLGTYEGLDAKGGLSVGKFLRIRVKLNLNNPLKSLMKLLIEGAVCEVHFRYERLPMHCYFCGRIGHGERDCEDKLDVTTANSGEPQYGGWLRATNDKKFSGLQLSSRTTTPPAKEGLSLFAADKVSSPKGALCPNIPASESPSLVGNPDPIPKPDVQISLGNNPELPSLSGSRSSNPFSGIGLCQLNNSTGNSHFLTLAH